jgi:hypothetical protein
MEYQININHIQMKKMLTTLVNLCWLHSCIFAQNSGALWASPELGYGWTLADKGQYSFVNDKDKMYMAIFHFKLRYYLTDELSLGAGIGVTPYHNYDITTAPIFVALQYDFARFPRLFTYADVGTLLNAETSSSDMLSSWLSSYEVSYTSGFVVNAGVGYRIASSMHRSLYVALEYHLFRHDLSISFTDEISDELLADKRAKHAILLRVGYTFDVSWVFD